MTTYDKINLFLDLLMLLVIFLWAYTEIRCRRYTVVSERAIKKEPTLIVIRSNNISYDKFEFVTDSIDDYEHSDTIEFYYEGRLVLRMLRDDIQMYYEKGHINMCNNILEGQKNGSKAS